MTAPFLAALADSYAGPSAGAEEGLDAILAAEEQALVQRAAALERSVRQHKAAKEAALAAKQLAEQRQAAEGELQRWQAELRAEVDGAIGRLQAQREDQLAKCRRFESTLEANVEQLQAMLLQVRRRASALDTAFDACVQRLSSSYAEAVAARRAQSLGELEQAAQQPQQAQ